MSQSRSGTILVQLMMTFGAASMLTLLIASLIHRSFSFVKDYRRTEANNLQIRNLGHTLRQDLLLASSLRLLESENKIATGIELKQIDGATILYTLSPREVLRTRQIETAADTDVSSQTTTDGIGNRNTFHLAKNWEARLEATEGTAQLTVVRRLPPNDGPSETILLRVASHILPNRSPSITSGSQTEGTER